MSAKSGKITIKATGHVETMDEMVRGIDFPIPGEDVMRGAFEMWYSRRTDTGVAWLEEKRNDNRYLGSVSLNQMWEAWQAAWIKLHD